MPRYKLRTLLIVLALTCLAFADEPGNQAVKTGPAQLQGQWVLVYWRYNGEDLDATKELGGAPGSETTMTISGTHFVVKTGQKVYEEGTVAIDSSASPATFDTVVTMKEGRDKKDAALGIYLLKDDLFIACVSYDGFRPRVFSAERNSHRELVIYRRK